MKEHLIQIVMSILVVGIMLPISVVGAEENISTNTTPINVTSYPTVTTPATMLMSPSVSLTTTKTTVEATSPAILTLSMVNPIVNNVNLVVQPILKVPSGVNVVASSFTSSGANQYTGLFTVRPGESNHITIQITSEELGPKTIEAQIIYFPEGNIEPYHQLQYTMTIYVKEKTTVTPTPIPTTVVPTSTPSPKSIPGFEANIMAIGILTALFLVKRIYNKER